MFWRLEIELKCGQGWCLWEALENLLQASLPVWGRVQPPLAGRSIRANAGVVVVWPVPLCVSP